MTASQRTWAQAEIRLAPGAEPWLVVRHRSGTFFLPASAQAGELLHGIKSGWDGRPKSVSHSSGYVRVPLDRWIELEAGEARRRL